jgi:P4 family phage/plasmid primase-like protien
VSHPAARTFADNVVAYAQAGWPCILPVPPQTKTPPPQGFTGADGRDPDALQLVVWASDEELQGYSIALRMPSGVIGIDVDQYVKGGKQKHGARTLEALTAQLGPLPATWSSTARGSEAGPGESRIMLFRVPEGRYSTRLSATHPDGSITGDVEIIQRHHRYAVVWPSAHGEAGTYTWYPPVGPPVTTPPRPSDLAELPTAWVTHLAAGAANATPQAADPTSGQHLLDQLQADFRTECADVTSAKFIAADAMAKADEGTRHDVMTERVYHLVQLAAAGHTGVGQALVDVRAAWEALTAGEDRTDELDRALLTAARKAVSVVGANQVPRDPCLFMAGGFPMPAPPDTDTTELADGTAVQIQAPPRWASAREILGTHSFDPNAGMDQTLAEKVLERVYPALRYAYDAKGWLLKVPERWELHGKLSGWAVATVASLMPVGDPDAEKGSDQQLRADRRKRLMTTAGARAIAGKMDDLVAGGLHPAAVALADLDADPNVLWAGGAPWSLRDSIEGPALATYVDPVVPHLHTAGVPPERRPTPMWDAFLEAVWPDPGLRRWAVRVLSISLTGYADRALPILLGETGRGKTQVVALLMSVLGSYAHAANPKLLAPTANEHDTIVFDLKGRRLSFIDEAPSEAKAGQERLKQLTGGGELTGRRMNQDPVTFMPTHTFVLTANDEPALTDPAVRSRVRLIPCEGDPEQVRRTRAAIGHVSGAAWRAEAPGVLAAMMAEAAGWLADPATAHVMAAPEGVRYLAEHLGAEQDPVSVWVSEETEPCDQGTPSRELYQAFTASCLRNNLRRDAIPSETKWGRALGRLGYPSSHSEHGKRRPLRLRTGGFLPGMTPLTGLDAATRQPEPTVTNLDRLAVPAGPDPDGLNRKPDGLLTGSEPNPSGVFPQVNPRFSVAPDGSDGLNTIPHTCAPAPAHRESDPGNPPNPSAALLVADPAEAAAALFDVPVELVRRPDPKPAPAKPKREQTEAAREKRATAAVEKRAAAIAEASGPILGLPAVVLRDGTVQQVTPEYADQLLATITDALTIDVEHTGYSPGHQHYALRTVQLGNENLALVHDPVDHAELIRRHVARVPVLHAHSATADLVPLEWAGLLEHGLEEAWSRMHDTVTLAKLADPSSTKSKDGLKQLAPALLGDQAVSPAAEEARSALFKAGKWLTETKPTTEPERSGWAQVDHRSTTMLRYDGSDVLDGAAIAKRLPYPEPHVWHREVLAQTMTARVAHHGLALDADHVIRLQSQQRADLENATQLLAAFGIENPGSDQQVAAVAEKLGLQLPRTPTGKPSVAKGVLEPFSGAEGPVGDLVRARLAYQIAENRLGLFLDGYRTAVETGDGRVRPWVYTMEAKTGRMSCVRPNLQQVPQTGGFRACIIADPGHVLISADFAGVELRVAAALSQDQALIAVLDDPERDIHQEIAQLVWGPAAGKHERYMAKRKVFGRIYGSGINGLVTADPPVSEPIARAIVDAMDQMTPGLTGWSRMVADGVDAGRTKFQAYSGRIIHMPTERPYAAPNYCIQGTARELLIDALERWSRTRWGGAVLLPVHDELVVHVPEADAEEATAALVECMTSELNGVRIPAEADEPSHFWRDAT